MTSLAGGDPVLSGAGMSRGGPLATDSGARLAAGLAAALELVRVSEDCLSAEVMGREISAASPAVLRHRLARLIYRLFHAGWDGNASQAPGGDRNEELEARLLAAMPYREAIREVIVTGGGGQHVYGELEGVAVHITREDVVDPAGWPPVPGARLMIRVPCARPALSPGFFAVEGTRVPDARLPILRVYLHLESPSAAVTAWGQVLGLLAGNPAGYRAKVSSRPGSLPRRDAMVIYLNDHARGLVPALAGIVAGLAGVGRETSVFAERIRPGLAIAWEPADTRPEMSGLSFGEHRSLAVADGLIRHASAGCARPLASAVCASLVRAGIDPANPARNVAA